MPEDGQLFLNGFKSGRSFVIDLRDPLQPSVASAFTTVGDFSFPHSFERLSNGNVIATFQNGKDGQVVTGGIAFFMCNTVLHSFSIDFWFLSFDSI